MKVRALALRILRELTFSPKGFVWLPTFSGFLSLLVYLFLTNATLSLMDQKTMMFMTAQAVLLLGVLAVAVVGADTVAGERDRGTLEALLAAPVSRGQLLGGYLAAALAPWAAMAGIALPYLAVVSAGSGGFPLTAAYLVGTGSVLALGVAAWTIGLSARTDSLRTAILLALVVYAGLAVPALLSSALRGNWVGRAWDFVDPFSNVMNTLDSVVIDEQALRLQLVRLLMLGAFTVGGLVYARHRLGTLSLD
jgi:ABC-2 type transport system permease protein